MNKKIKLSKIIKDTSLGEQRFGVFVEHMDRKFDQVLEGHMALDNKIERIDRRVSGLDQKVDIINSGLGDLRNDMSSSFCTIMEHLSNIEEDLKAIKRVEDLERRFNLLELKLKEKHVV